MEKTPLEKELEKIFTIDGRGTARKCKYFLELLQKYEEGAFFQEIEKMSQRKF